ncbi:MAG: GyrI-like domain-containing protein [Sedimentisphaerales bacterium]|nr:GyrI-like domain-containing protein [Sedimentisphaerales bacterium]
MTASDKLDLYKIHKDQYATPKAPILVTVDQAAYLSIDGRGAPGGPEFADKIGALYGMAYTVKMTRKFDGAQDYVICKLEALWWLDNPGQTFETAPQENWNWKLMIRTPDFVETPELERAATTLIEKGKAPQARQVHLERLGEGLCVQMLHVGPYEEERRTLAQMETFAREQGLAFHGPHHEIYLSDPRRVPLEKLKTILRHPVRP